MVTIVADLGNSRLKWGRLDRDGSLRDVIAVAVDDPARWAAVWEAWQLGSLPSRWSVSSVNPPLAERLAAFLAERGVASVHWFRSAADVPVRHDLEAPETAGADRAFAVLGALAVRNAGGPGIVVSCGTAVTVERIAASGVWLGGAIAAGLGLTARALHMLTAQLPLVEPGATPAAWGRSTRPALEAGVYWGVVGAIRELVSRQAAGVEPSPWRVWTGGDAARLAPAVDGEDASVVPDLVLHGLAGLERQSGRRER
ncbi:MAG: type III pantothenate kinase [Isosphaeraceae bacterium]|nr:type III pantothenate kinase [Isosphaeraceae bacterium]